MRAFETGTLKIDKGQQKILDEFFKEETTYFPNHVLADFITGLFVFVSFILNVMPYHAWEKEGFSYVFLMGYVFFCMGIYFYAGKYYSFTEELTKKTVVISKLLSALPVNRWQLVIFRIRKIMKICLIMAAVTVVVRCLISVYAYSSVSVWDILMPLGLLVLFPAAVEITRW